MHNNWTHSEKVPRDHFRSKYPLRESAPWKLIDISSNQIQSCTNLLERKRAETRFRTSNEFESIAELCRLITGPPYRAKPTSRRAKVFRTSPSRDRRLTWPRNRAGTVGGINDLGRASSIHGLRSQEESFSVESFRRR